MGNLWLRITVRRSRRATWTIVGLALCTMYLSGTIALVGGLHETTAGISSTFKQGPIVVYRGATLSDSRMPLSTVADLASRPAIINLISINLSVLGGTPMQAYAATIDDAADVLGFHMTNLTSEDAMLGAELSARFEAVGTPLYMGARLNLSSDSASRTCQVTAVYVSGTLIPPDWVIVNDEAMMGLNRADAANCSFVVLPEGDLSDKAALESMGYTSQNSMAVINFFELGVYQIEGALWGLILITGVIVCLLIYSTISIEVRARRDDIRLLKKMGSEPERIGSLFVARGLYLSLCGGVVGVCAGYFAAHLLVSMASLRGLTTLIVPQASLESLALPMLVAVVASLIGSAIPSFFASREPMGGAA